MVFLTIFPHGNLFIPQMEIISIFVYYLCLKFSMKIHMEKVVHEVCVNGCSSRVYFQHKRNSIGYGLLSCLPYLMGYRLVIRMQFPE